MSADASPPWLSESRDAWAIHLHIQPNAATTSVVGLHGDALKLRLAAPPIDGRANEALIAFLSARLDVPRRAIRVAHGASGRSKRIEIDRSAIGRDSLLERLVATLR